MFSVIPCQGDSGHASRREEDILAIDFLLFFCEFFVVSLEYTFFRLWKFLCHREKCIWSQIICKLIVVHTCKTLILTDASSHPNFSSKSLIARADKIKMKVIVYVDVFLWTDVVLLETSRNSAV